MKNVFLTEFDETKPHLNRRDVVQAEARERGASRPRRRAACSFGDGERGSDVDQARARLCFFFVADLGACRRQISVHAGDKTCREAVPILRYRTTHLIQSFPTPLWVIPPQFPLAFAIGMLQKKKKKRPSRPKDNPRTLTPGPNARPLSAPALCECVPPCVRACVRACVHGPLSAPVAWQCDPSPTTLDGLLSRTTVYPI